MGLPPWETSESQMFALITGANSGLGYGISARLIDEFITSPSTPPNKHLVLILCTRTALKTRFTISRLRGHLRLLAQYSDYAKKSSARAKGEGRTYNWEDTANRVHFLGVELDLCDLKNVYAVADRLVNGSIGSPDATTIDGLRLPHGSPGTQSFSPDIKQDRWALSQEPGSDGAQRSWGWGLSGIRIPRLDVIMLCAGMGGWTGIDWVAATRAVLFDMIEAVTWPSYKLADVGAVVKKQNSYQTSKPSGEKSQLSLSNSENSDEPPLGEVFCSNIFGHYILAHELTPLLSRASSTSAQTGGKIIFVSSIEALPEALSVDDIQALKSIAPYESTKRLMDLLVLTSELPSVKRVASPFFDESIAISHTKSKSTDEKEHRGATNERQMDVPQIIKPKLYITHPGIFVSEILPLNFIFVVIYRFIFFLARWLGSPWHTIDPYKAAVAPVWLSLIDSAELDEIEGHGARKAKWGSATNTSGEERVMKTEVPGWGWDGQVEKTISGERRIGRKRGAADLTQEEKEKFEILGAKCWSEVEALRREWEGILGVGTRKL